MQVEAIPKLRWEIPVVASVAASLDLATQRFGKAILG